MKVARLYRYDDIRIEDVPVPRIGPRDALVKTKVCGICSGDVMPWYIEKKAPLVLGHEPVGVIVELGPSLLNDDTAPKLGDRVFVHHHAPCMDCSYCRRGDFVQCETWRRSKIVPGGLAEYFLVPETNLTHDTLLLPEDMSDEDGALIEPAACVVKSLRRSGMKRGDTVLILGLGVMGQMHVLLSGKFGAERIIAADLVPYRLAKARESGADHIVDVSRENLRERVKSLTGGHGAEVVIIGPNNVAAMLQGMEVASRGGTAVLFTPAKPGEVLKIDPNDLYFRDISIITSYSCGPDDTRQAFRFIGEGIVTAKKLVTHRFGIDETEDAFRLTAEAKDSLKCLIVF